jgi:hypothetical protein
VVLQIGEVMMNGVWRRPVVGRRRQRSRRCKSEAAPGRFSAPQASAELMLALSGAGSRGVAQHEAAAGYAKAPPNCHKARTAMP